MTSSVSRNSVRLTHEIRVLIIDSSTLFHDILNKVFLSMDMTPVFFEHAAQALKVLEAEQFDCICLSMYMADGDGITLTKAIRSIKKQAFTPIFLLTAEESQDIYQRALASGVTEVFNKQNIIQLINFIQRFTLQQHNISGHVLYIEDTLSQQQMITKMFNNKGLTVDAFSSAEEAWHSYIHNDYDLVVTDIIVKGNMTGMALTNRIRRLGGEKGDVPILAITAFDDISRRIELFYLGISDYVIKPIIEEELIARVRHLIKGKQFYMESLKQKHRAEEADIAKSEFIAHMNHELRTPLNAIQGYSTLIMNDAEGGLSTDQKENLDEIQHAGRHLLELINDISDISKIEAGIVDINIKIDFLSNIVDTSINRLMPLAKKSNIEILPYTIQDSLQVQSDPLRLHQVLINLLSNAIKYNSKNGTVEILCQNLKNGFVRLGIKDTGNGIDETEQVNLFKPFNRLGHGTEIEGTGLGLVISNRFMELMSGTIELDSKKGQGSTFWITIPTA
jgi:signal transduction histidine kinase